jgi:multidrug efflux pump subunit AcrB
MSARTDPSRKYGGPIAWMATHPVAANISMLVLVIGGFLALLKTKQEVFPEFELDLVVAGVTYPGASPEEVEQGIILPIEEAVRGLEGVKEVRSTAAEGGGVVSVELLLGANGDKVLAEVKSAVDRIQIFPRDAERPVVSLATRRREVISLVLAGDQSPRTLHALAERVRSELLAHPDITQVDLQGVRPVEVAIAVDRQTLEGYGLTLEEVARQVTAAQVELPAGTVKTRAGELLVRLSERRREGHEFENVILRGTRTGAEVRLGDVARITDGYAETDQASYYNGRPAVRLVVYRVGDQTPTGVASAVRASAESARSWLPPEIELAVWSDNSEVLKSRVDLLVRNGRTGLFLVFLMLALFLRLRVAGWVATGIPICFLGAFLLLPWFDTSINMITLFAFIVVLGMVVDDAIVVGENVNAMVEKGHSRMEAAILGARRMAVPVTFSVLTTVAAFSPLLFIPGVMGKIFSNVPVVVIAVLALSLYESFFILPAHLGHGQERPLRGPAAAWARFQQRIANGFLWFGEHVYRPSLELALRIRYITISVAVACLIIAGALVGSGKVPFSFFPRLESDVVTASARLPYGAPLERTLEVRAALEQAAKEAIAESGGDRILRGVFTRVGEGSNPASREKGAHLLTVELNLVPSDDRDVGANEIAAKWSKRMPPLPGLESLIIAAVGGPGAGKPVDVQLSHTSPEVLARASQEVAQILKGYPALSDVDNAYSRGKPQLDLQLRPEGRALGLTSVDLARQLRASLFGAEAVREQRGRDEMRVMVRWPEEQRRSEYDLETMLVSLPGGGRVPLADVATVERGQAPTSIVRQDGRRIVNVTAELAPGVRSPREVIDSLKADVFPRLQQQSPGLIAEMGGQQREQAEAFGALGRGFALAMLVIFVLLALPLRSYLQPLLIMTAIPFGFVGAVAGHVLLGYGLSLMSLLGIVALSGVVVNDSLVMIDAANEAREGGKTPYEAIVHAGTRRLRAIFLTSITTFVGLAPMLLEKSMQARFLIPMAISLAFGILFATFIILVVVPSLYMAAEDGKGLLRRLVGSGRAVEPEPVPGNDGVTAP